MTEELDYLDNDNGDIVFNGKVVGRWDSTGDFQHNNAPVQVRPPIYDGKPRKNPCISATVKGEGFGPYNSRKELDDAILDFLVRGILPPENERQTRWWEQTPARE